MLTFQTIFFRNTFLFGYKNSSALNLPEELGMPFAEGSQTADKEVAHIRQGDCSQTS